MDCKSFFDNIASDWDERVNHDPNKIKYIFSFLSLSEGDYVLDVGTGTGVLLPYIREKIGKEGIIDAIDISPGMIRVAKEKFTSLGVEFIVDDIMNHPVNNRLYDSIICYSVFPHFKEQMSVVRHLSSMLSEKGELIICHSQSRSQINNLHNNSHETVKNDILPPIEEVALMYKRAGLRVERMIDETSIYLITGKYDQFLL